MAGGAARGEHGRRPMLRSAAVVVAVAAAIGVLGAGVAAPEDNDAGEGIQHVALGDSYSSGQGAGEYDEGTEAPWRGGDGCYRSAHAYARGLLEAAELNPAETELVACGGATAAGLIAAADEPASAPQPAKGQLQALSSDTDLVTLTIGGNDAGFAEILTTCHAAERCDELFSALTPDGAEDLVTQRIAASFHAVVSGLQAIKDEAEHAAIMLVEYPRLLDPEAEAVSGLAPEELDWLDERNSQLNDMLADAAATAGVTFVDGVAEEFAGHEVNADEPWIRGADPAALPHSGTAEWFHPTAEGQAAIRDVVAAELGDELPKNPAPQDPSQSYPDDVSAPTIAPLRWNEGFLPAQVPPGERLTGRITAEPIVGGNTYDVVLHPGSVTLASGISADSDGELTIDTDVPEGVPEGLGALVVEGSGHAGEHVVLTGPAVVGDLPVSLPARIDRLAGPDRAATAAAVAADAFPDGSDAAVLASSEGHADALAGGPLAATLDAPLLLTHSNGLPEPTAAALEALEVSEVTIVGGEAAVSPGVANDVADLDAIEGVHRVAGETRYATAAAIAEEIAEVTGSEPTLAFLAASQTALPGTGWPDAVSVGAYAGASAAPVLLTRPDELPEATAEALDELVTGGDAIVAGGPIVVHDVVVDEVAEIVGEAPTRLAGLTRYGTSSAVARAAVEAGVLGPTEVWVATGRHWADALAAGPAAARNDASLVLVDGEAPILSLATLLWLSREDTATDRLVLVGGTAAIDESFVGRVID